MLSRLLLFVLALGILQSCASKHPLMRGSVALKIDDSSGIACLESDEVKVGDRLYLYNNDCSLDAGDRRGQSCKMVKAGEVEVTRLVNDHYSEFKTTSKLDFAEGSIIGTGK